jgi:hypothetical protein
MIRKHHTNDDPLVRKEPKIVHNNKQDCRSMMIRRYASTVTSKFVVAIADMKLYRVAIRKG